MAKRTIIPILTALIALLLVSTQATNPGIRLRITDKGLQYGKSRHFRLQNLLFYTGNFNDLSLLFNLVRSGI